MKVSLTRDGVHECHFIISLSQNSVHTVVLHHYISINCRNIGDTGANCHMGKLSHRVKSQKLECFESKVQLSKYVFSLTVVIYWFQTFTVVQNIQNI